jgi:peptidoglycan hydrolase-like protein with peptidoglycan-binding domain
MRSLVLIAVTRCALALAVLSLLAAAPTAALAVGSHAPRVTTLLQRLQNSPFKPTQAASKMDLGKVRQFADLMRQGKWAWSSTDKIIVDSQGAIMSGHHRVMAAMEAGIAIPESAVIQYQGVTVRQVFEWAEVLLP